MIRRKNEVRERIVENAQGGTGKVLFRDWLEPETEAVGHGRVISQVIIYPGSSIGVHKHEGEFEAYYVLSGQGIVNDNGVESVLDIGDVHLCKNGETHGIKNESEENLVLNVLILNDLSGAK